MIVLGFAAEANKLEEMKQKRKSKIKR